MWRARPYPGSAAFYNPKRPRRDDRSAGAKKPLRTMATRNMTTEFIALRNANPAKRRSSHESMPSEYSWSLLRWRGRLETNACPRFAHTPLFSTLVKFHARPPRRSHSLSRARRRRFPGRARTLLLRSFVTLAAAPNALPSFVHARRIPTMGTMDDDTSTLLSQQPAKVRCVPWTFLFPLFSDPSPSFIAFASSLSTNPRTH